LRNIDSNLPFDESTYFRIASISKSFTATGLLIALESSEYELDDDISDALGYLVRNSAFPYTPITFRMVLSHTSSLQDGDSYAPFLTETYNASQIPSIAEVLLADGEYYTLNMWRTEEPGTYFAYSNINYGLIGTLIEAISKHRFDVFMKHNLLEPLDISGS